MSLQSVWKYFGTQATLFSSPLPSCRLFWSAVVTVTRATAHCCQFQVIKTDNPPTVVSPVWSLKRTYVFDMIRETILVECSLPGLLGDTFRMLGLASNCRTMN
jgi:hypothetical protein